MHRLADHQFAVIIGTIPVLTKITGPVQVDQGKHAFVCINAEAHVGGILDRTNTRFENGVLQDDHLADQIVAVVNIYTTGDGDHSHDADNGNHYHQLDQREAGLVSLFKHTHVS